MIYSQVGEARGHCSLNAQLVRFRSRIAQSFLFRKCEGIAFPGLAAQASMPAPPEALWLFQSFLAADRLLSMRFAIPMLCSYAGAKQSYSIRPAVARLSVPAHPCLFPASLPGKRASMPFQSRPRLYFDLTSALLRLGQRRKEKQKNAESVNQKFQKKM